jgi:hypothetical protein
MEQPVLGTHRNGLNSQPSAQNSPPELMNTVWSEHRTSHTHNFRVNTAGNALYRFDTTEAPTKAQNNAQFGDVFGERAAKRTKLLPPGGALGYQLETVNSTPSHSLAVQSDVNHTFISTHQPKSSLIYRRIDSKTTAPTYQSHMATSHEARDFLASSPCVPEVHSEPALAAAGKVAVDRIEAAALLLGIRALGERMNIHTARSTPLKRRDCPNDISRLNEYCLAAHNSSSPTSHFPPPPPPSSFFQVVDTRATTLEGFYWSWLLTGPGLARDRPPLLPYSTPQTHSSVLPWPDFIFGEPSAAMTWSFV